MTMQDSGQAPQRRRNRRTGEVQVLVNGQWQTQSGGMGQEYARVQAREQAKLDVDRYSNALAGRNDAFERESAADEALRLLQTAPTGPNSELRTDLANRGLGWLPWVPERDEADNLTRLRQLGSEGVLGTVGELKGPLSDRDVTFLREMQINPDASPEANRRVAEAHRWAARRQAAYGSAMSRWVRDLGSPSARNAEGLSFDDWWSDYSARELPRPGTYRNVGYVQPGEAPPEGFVFDPERQSYVKTIQIGPGDMPVTAATEAPAPTTSMSRAQLEAEARRRGLIP